MTKQLMVAIVESQRVRVWISKWKIKCFRVVSNAKSFDVLRFCSFVVFFVNKFSFFIMPRHMHGRGYT